jgi:RNA exonuclease 4
VTDARATLAIYRLHRKQWEKGYAVIPIRVPYKAKEKDIGDQLAPEPEISQRSSGDDRSRRTSLPSRTSEGKTTYRKGVSSGLSTIVRHRSKVNSGVGGSKNKWWSELGGAQARDGSKGSIRVVT